MDDNSAAARTFATPRAALWATLAAVPWTWFLIRDWHPLLDLVAIAMPLASAFAVVLLLGLAIRGFGPAALVALSVALVALLAIGSPRRDVPNGPPDGGAVFMSANLESRWFSDNDLAWFVQQRDPGLLVASEMQRSHRDDLRNRFAHYVDQVIIEEQFRTEPAAGDDSYKRYGFPSIGVYSEYPLEELEDTTGIQGGLPGMRLRVELPTGPVVLYALHVPKPGLGSGVYEVGFAEHRDIADKLAESIANETLPVVVLGDLNMTDRGGAYRRILDGNVRDVMAADAPRSTSTKGFWWDLLFLRIDHLLLSPGLCAESQDYDFIDFSDHLVISATVGPCPNTQA